MFWVERALHRCAQRVYDLAQKDLYFFKTHRDGDRLLQSLNVVEESGSTARYTDAHTEFTTLPRKIGIFSKRIVMGIDYCNR